jgi:hypothetical protein
LATIAHRDVLHRYHLTPAVAEPVQCQRAALEGIHQTGCRSGRPGGLDRVLLP